MSDDAQDPFLHDPQRFEQMVDDAQTFTGTFKFNETSWFPFAIHLPPDCTITLHADGKWEGSIEGLREKLVTGKSVGTDAQLVCLLWLLLREMERDGVDGAAGTTLTRCDPHRTAAR